MLKKAERIARPDFAAFFKKGKKLHSDHVFAVISPHPTFHASVVVSKKVAKSAVERNTYRRRVYAHLQKLRQQGFRGVVIITLKPTFSGLTRVEAKTAIEALIVRIEKSA